MIVDITKENFQELVVDNSKNLPVLVDFWSPNCGPCLQIMPQLESLAQEMTDQFILAKVNTEEQPELADHFQIKSIPSFKVFKNANVVAELVGAQPISEIKDLLKPHLQADPSEELRQQAQVAFHDENYSEVVNLLGQAAQANPNNYLVHLDLVKMYLHTGSLEEAQNLFAKLPEEAQNSPEGKPLNLLMEFSKIVHESAPITEIQATLKTNPNDASSLYGLVGYLMINRAYEEALQTLLKLFMVEREFKEGIAQKTLLKTFNALQADQPELVKSYRRKFQGLLF